MSFHSLAADGVIPLLDLFPHSLSRPGRVLGFLIFFPFIATPAPAALQKPCQERLVPHGMNKEEYMKVMAACDVGLIFLDHRFTIPNFPSRLLSYIAEDDAEFMMRLVGDPKVTKFIPGMILDREMLISWIHGLRPMDHEYIIAIEETEEEIGECSLTEQGTSCEIGFMLLPQFWRQGYGTEVVHSLVEKARGLGIKELTATTDSRNKAAIRLLEKTGFKKQKSGWMVMIPEDEAEKMEEGQTIIQFQRNI